MKNKHINEYVKVIENQLKEAGKANNIIEEALVEPVVRIYEELKNNQNKFCFSEVKACEKCGAFFVSDSLLMDHENNDHVGHGESELNEDNPEEILLKEQQFHCALVDSPSCQFQCGTK